MTHPAAPVVLFGAFDRHNLGDLLLARVAGRLSARPAIFAGLAERDLRPWGGPQVIALPRLVAEWERNHGQAPLELMHVGGELLDCDTWEAAVMLSPPEAAQAVIARLDADPVGRSAWAQGMLGCARQAPYVVPRAALPAGARVSLRAVGGVGLAQREASFREEVFAALRQAEWLTVRDEVTRGILAGAGIDAPLEADPVNRLAELFGKEIGEHMGQGEVAAVRAAFPQGYVAAQFATEYGDDRTLAALSNALDELWRKSGWGVVLFRAGAAPWHDALEPYQRLAARLAAPCRVFQSLHIWDICALIAAAKSFIGSSLHSRIVARTFGTIAASLERQPGSGAKLRAWCRTWEPGAYVVAPEELAAAIG